jgi:hypothetical protein
MPRRKLMLLVDYLLLILIILLNSPLFTSLQLHEFLGIFLMLPFFIHLLLSWKWIAHCIRYFFLQQNLRNKINVLLNSILFVLCILAFASGFIISQYVLPGIGISTINDWKWRALHNQASVGIVFVASIHIAINWLRIVSYFKKSIAGKLKKEVVFSSTTLIPAMRRNLWMLIVAFIIVMITLSILGQPSKDRLYTNNDIIRLQQNFTSGSIQLIGMVITVVILVLLVRQFMKIRL